MGDGATPGDGGSGHGRMSPLRAERGDLYMDLLTLLCEWDPMGIGCFPDVNRVAYEPEVELLWPRLGTVASQDDLQDLVYAVMVVSFGTREVGPIEQYEALTSRMWEIIERRRDEMSAAGGVILQAGTTPSQLRPTSA